jgi:hypothetical protein
MRRQPLTGAVINEKADPPMIETHPKNLTRRPLNRRGEEHDTALEETRKLVVVTVRHVHC